MTTTKAVAPHYDVVIAGGGMVGASLALQLSQYSLKKIKILLVESFPIPAKTAADERTAPVYSPGFDARSTALSYGSRLILESLKLWPLLAQHSASINSIHVSDRGHFGSATMSGKTMGWPALGYVVENAWLGNVLLSQLRQQPNVHFLTPASVASIKSLQQGVELVVKQQTSTVHVHAQLAVIADGANSGLRQQLGINASTNDYQQTALIANVSFQQPHQGCAYERFTDQGPMALLPLSDSELGEPRAALVWSLPVTEAEFLLNCDEQIFLQRLQQRFGHRQGKFTRVGDRFSFPLQLIQAQEQVRSGVVVMGNAAHSLHPVAGQGFNLALRDSCCLSKLLVAAFANNKPLGELALLDQYLQQQRFDQQKIITFSDRLPALFNARQLPLSILRAIGLGVLDLTPPLKNNFIAHAAGFYDGAALG